MEWPTDSLCGQWGRIAMDDCILGSEGVKNGGDSVAKKLGQHRNKYDNLVAWIDANIVGYLLFAREFIK